MKKLSLLALLIILTCKAQATVTFNLIANPCDTNKILVASFSTALTASTTVHWYGSNGTHSTAPSGLTDTLFHYSGNSVTIMAYSGSWAVVDSGTFAGVAPPFTFAFAPNAPHCGATGTASVTVTGGTPPFSYYWQAGWPTATVATTNPATLPNGIYSIVIIDAAGCINGTNIGIGSFYLYDTIQITPTYSVALTSTSATCTNGTATSSLSGGFVPPVSYLWSNGATTPSISGLTMGNYNLTTTDALGCIATDNTHVYQGVDINVNTTPTPATCLASDGAVIAFASGGMPPYSYVWSNGATTASQTGIPAGSLYVTATDANGCLGTGYAYISASTPITITYAATPSLCTSPTGTATLSVSGGTAPYSYTFYTSPLQTGSPTATNLAPGTYQFKVVDAVGCIRTGAVIVPPVNVINLSFTQTPALCTLSNGNMTVAATGGATPYTYAWNTGATTSGITGKPAGWYTVTITDNVNCKVSATKYLSNTSPVTVGMSSVPATCLFTNNGSATATPVGGTAPYTYSWSNGGSTPTISGLRTGDYWATVTDVNGCTDAWNYTFVNYDHYDSSCLCVIKGTVYHDVNGNCVQDAGEPGINHIQLHCSGIGYTYTNAAGEYYFLVPAGSYTITQTILSYWPLASCQSNNISVTTSAGFGCSHTVDFADAMNPIHDVSIQTWDASFAVPGNVYSQAVIINNNGTTTEGNVLGGYNTDGQIFAPTFMPSSSFAAGSPTWYSTSGGVGPSLAPGASLLYYLDYNVPTYIPMGTELVFKDTAAYQSPVSNWLTDYSPWNNVNYFTTTVVSSYDPNFIEVSPKGWSIDGNISHNDTVLTYMVHFQNTGTYKAQNIVVIDTLDPDLDYKTLRPSFASAECKVSLSQNGVVTYTFPNINLPPESQEPIASNGMFSYTIKTKSGLPYGTQFKNRAAIYFDYNAPIITNTAVNTIWFPQTVTTVNDNRSTFEIYPNPASHTFNAIINSTHAADADMSITNVTGQVLMSKTVALQEGKQTITSDASSLAPGIYFVSFNDHGSVQTAKLVIMK